MLKWTHTIQTCIVQGSTVLAFSREYKYRNRTLFLGTQNIIWEERIYTHKRPKYVKQGKQKVTELKL